MQAPWEERATRSAPQPSWKNQRLLSGPQWRSCLFLTLLMNQTMTLGALSRPAPGTLQERRLLIPQRPLEALAQKLWFASWVTGAGVSRQARLLAGGESAPKAEPRPGQLCVSTCGPRVQQRPSTQEAQLCDWGPVLQSLPQEAAFKVIPRSPVF